MYARRLATNTQWAESFEYQHPEWERERTLKYGDWQGPTFFWNMRSDGHGWTRVAEVYTDYKAVPELWPDHMNVETDYWEIVPEDHEGPSKTPRQHLGSFCNEETAKRELRRLQEAQHRARIILACKEIDGMDILPSVKDELRAHMLSSLFRYPMDIVDTYRERGLTFAV